MGHAAAKLGCASFVYDGAGPSNSKRELGTLSSYDSDIQLELLSSASCPDTPAPVPREILVSRIPSVRFATSVTAVQTRAPGPCRFRAAVGVPGIPVQGWLVQGPRYCGHFMTVKFSKFHYLEVLGLVQVLRRRFHECEVL